MLLQILPGVMAALSLHGADTPPAPAQTHASDPAREVLLHHFLGEPREGQVVSRSETAPDGDNRFQRILILTAGGKHLLIRLQQDLRRDPNTGAERLERQTSMVADHIIVRLRPGVGREQLEAAVAGRGEGIRKSLRLPGAFLLTCDGREPQNLPSVVEAWNRHPFVQYAEPDYIVEANALYPSDPMFGSQWALNNSADADIDAPEAWDLASDASGVLVAILDTGLDMQHLELAGNLWTNPRDLPGDMNGDGFPGVGGVDDDGDGLIDEDSLGRSRFLPDGATAPLWINDLVGDDDENGYPDDVHGWDFANHDNDPSDDYFHGTHMSGILGALGDNGTGISGIAWRVSLMPLKFMSPSVLGGATGLMSDAAEAMQYAVSIGARITSNSYGSTGYSQLMDEAIQSAAAAGVVVVASAGNSGTNNDLAPVYPASYAAENVIAVAASDESDAHAVFSSSAASNYGPVTVHLSAPGKTILGTMPREATAGMSRYGYDVLYEELSGTSPAVPQVAGVCALLRSLAPTLTAAQVRGAVLGTVDVKPGLIGKTATSGRLNAHAALASLSAPCVTIGTPASIEEAGNGDGILNPGETVRLTMELQNVGGVGASGVTATLAPAGPESTVVPGAATWDYGAILPYGTSAGAGTFLVTLSHGLTTPATAILNVTIGDSAGQQWVRPVVLQVYTSSRISGFVTLDGVGLPDATVTCTGVRRSEARTLADGSYSVTTTDGTWTLSASCAGGLATPTVQKVTPPDLSGVNFPFTKGTIRGSIVDAVTGAPVEGASVRYWGDLAGIIPATGGAFEFQAAFGKPATLFLTARSPRTHVPAAQQRITVPPYEHGLQFRLAQSPGYVVHDIGTLPGGTQTVASDVSDRGEVVGRALDAAGMPRPMAWNAWTGLRSLDFDSSGLSGAAAINNRGDVAGRIARATAWYDGVPVDLGAFVPLPGSTATGINEGRLVVGHSLVSTTSNIWQAFLFRDLNDNLLADAGEMLCLGTLGGLESRAEAINPAGQVAGSALTADRLWRAFVFRDTNDNHAVDPGEMTALGTLYSGTPALNAASLANAINGHGHVVGQASGPAGTHAFLFVDANGNGAQDPGEMRDLGDLGVAGMGHSVAYGVNDAGEVVGTGQVGNQALYEAFLWRDGTMMNLHDLVEPDGWFFNAAYAINNRGWIVGFGLRDAVARAFLLVPWSDCNANNLSDLGDVAARASLDCNRNLVPDECEIASGELPDVDGNGVPDTCDLHVVSWSSVRVHGGPELTITLEPGGTAERGMTTEPRSGGVQLLRIRFDRPAALEASPVVSSSDGSNPQPTWVLSEDDTLLDLTFSAGALLDGVCHTVDLEPAVVDRETRRRISGDADCRIRVLAGDVDADGSVTTADALQTSLESAQPLTDDTAICDCNVDGTIDAVDTAMVQARIGHSAFCTSVPLVVGRHLFYSGSKLKLDSPLAPAPDKRPLLPGQMAAFSNISSYTKGLTGIYVDIANLPGIPKTSDFTFRQGNTLSPAAWSAAPLPKVSILSMQGNGGSSRIKLVWTSNAIGTRQWLQVTVKPSARTGLTVADVFYYGLLIGETGLGNTPSAAYVSAADWNLVKASYSSNSRDYRTILELSDLNRDSLVNGTDYAACIAEAGDPNNWALLLFTPPP